MDVAMPEIQVEEYSRIDLLDRQEFVDSMLEIVGVLSENRKNACFSIEGEWGVGKSFVLDMFEEQSGKIYQEETILPRFLIIRYNCWEYDYYEEPVIAMVAAILDSIEANVNLLPSDIKEKTVGVLKVIGKRLLQNATRIIEEKTGVPAGMIADGIKEGFKNADSQTTEKWAFDEQLTFRKTLKELRETVGSLAKDQTVVFIVDELDRCLPKYAIKVLERIHHLFEGIENVQVVLSIDKTQLEHTVHQIYGDGTDADKYLAKFIDFSMKLTEGTFNERFDEKFNKYLQFFDYIYPTATVDAVYEFRTDIFAGIDIRNRIAIIEKCILLHGLLNKSDVKQDFTIMGIEIFLMVIKYWHIDFQRSIQNFARGHGDFFSQDSGYVPSSFQVLSERYNSAGEFKYIKSKGMGAYVRTNDLWGLLLAVFRYIAGENDDEWLHGNADYQLIREYSKTFWNLLQTVS